MIKGLMKAEYYGKKDRSSEGFYGIGDSYPKKLCAEVKYPNLLPAVLYIR